MSGQIAHLHLGALLQEVEKNADGVDFLSVGVLQVDNLVDTGAFIFNDAVDETQSEVGEAVVALNVFQNGEEHSKQLLQLRVLVKIQNALVLL